MNLLLFLFAIPFATIIFSIILQKLINSPILVAFAIFSIFIILALTVFDDSFFILAVVYAIISYIAAILTRIIGNITDRCGASQNLTNWNNQIIQNESSNVIGSTNEYNDKSDIIIEKNNLNRKCWR